MFLEHKHEGEIQQAPARVLKLSEAIRLGSALVRETHSSHCGCAIGMAAIAYTGRELHTLVPFDIVHTGGTTYQHEIARLSGVPCAVVGAAESKHMSGIKAAKVADWLESQGY